MGMTLGSEVTDTKCRIDNLINDLGLTLFQKILLSTDGTVTELISLYCGAPIRARKVDQSLQKSINETAASASEIESLAVATNLAILARTVLLENDTGTPYLHATSYFVYDRLSAAMQRDLLETNLPIGLLWRRERFETHREIIAYHRIVNSQLAMLLKTEASTPLLSRSYRIHHSGLPIGLITETFSSKMFL
jgi:chorismate-pyruvate lyase